MLYPPGKHGFMKQLPGMCKSSGSHLQDHLVVLLLSLEQLDEAGEQVRLADEVGKDHNFIHFLFSIQG